MLARASALGAFVAAGAAALSIIVWSYAAKQNSCILDDTIAHHSTAHLVGLIQDVGVFAGLGAVVVGIAAALTLKRVGFSLGMAALGAAAGFYCLASAIGIAICEG